MQWTTPLWAETAGTSHSGDEEVSTSSAPLTRTYGGDGMRLYDQVVRCTAGSDRGADLDAAHNRPTKKETECALHTKPEGVGLESPLEYIAQREAGHRRLSPQQAGGLTEAASPNNATARSSAANLSHS
jgi:hypothetical protein